MNYFHVSLVANQKRLVQFIQLLRKLQVPFSKTPLYPVTEHNLVNGCQHALSPSIAF